MAAAQPSQQEMMARAVQMNAAARQAVVTNAVKMTQLIYGQTLDPTKGDTVNIPPRNVGLILGFIVEIAGTLTNGAGSTANRTELGALNLVKNFTFQDLNSTTRINTTGWHIGLLNSARQGFGFGGAYAPNLPVNFGNNWTVQSAPATIAASTDATVSQIFYVPLAYSAYDLRGAIYAAVTNATMNLQIQVNTSPFQATGDATSQVYSGNAGAWKTGTNITINVYQVYYDQIPRMQDKNGNVGPVLPSMDLSTIYDLKQTSVQGMSANQDFPYSFANFRNFLSAFAIYDNAGTLNVGSDVNYWSLQSANFTNIFKVSPKIAALNARQTFMADPPKGVYYFDFRDRPINTNQFGNMDLVLNASAVTTGATLLVGVEAFAYPDALQSQSLAAG